MLANEFSMKSNFTSFNSGSCYYLKQLSVTEMILTEDKMLPRVVGTVGLIKIATI